MHNTVEPGSDREREREGRSGGMSEERWLKLFNGSSLNAAASAYDYGLRHRGKKGGEEGRKGTHT